MNRVRCRLLNWIQELAPEIASRAGSWINFRSRALCALRVSSDFQKYDLINLYSHAKHIFKIYFIELCVYIAIKKSLYFLCGTWICFRSQLLKHIQEPAPVVAQDPPIIKPESQLRHSIMESIVYIVSRQNQPSAFTNHQITRKLKFSA